MKITNNRVKIKLECCTMIKEYITIADIQYYTTKEQIKRIALVSGFDKVVFTKERRNKIGYYKAIFKGDFKSFRDKLIASRKAKYELDEIEVV